VRRLAGDYAFYDDGWQATLSLRVDQDGHIDTEFRAYDRTRGRFAATAEFDDSDGPRLVLAVRDFNELPEQRYEGYVFRRGPVAIAGRTEWKGQPFSFFARRQPPYTLGPLQPEGICPLDFLGVYGLYCDGEHATMILSSAEDSALRGCLREDGSGREYPVHAVIDPVLPYCLKLTVGNLPLEEPPTLTLLMFRQRRTAMAGWLDWAGLRLGCYLIRHAGVRQLGAEAGG
jgi:hypothetical protein